MDTSHLSNSTKIDLIPWGLLKTSSRSESRGLDLL